MALNEQIAELDSNSSTTGLAHTNALTVQSVPGIGAVLGAEFLATVGGGREEFGSADALAAFAGVAPAPRALCHGLASTPTSPERFHVEASQARSAPA
ncbi:transposase [Streptomyces sp. NPDC101225]|uniref:transposase n=1 Tax=Streptomyces sp. NPDC101225 TaxID=3366135 RepID=UPI0038275110